MGQIFHRITSEQIAGTIEALTLAASSFTAVLAKMKEVQMESAMFPWAQRQWDAQDVIATLAAECEAKIQPQINAHKQGRPSQYEIIKERSARTVERRNQRKMETGENLPKKPRGRPKKGTT